MAASSLKTMEPYVVITVLCLLMMVMIRPAKSDQALLEKVCSYPIVNTFHDYCIQVLTTDRFALRSDLSGLARIALANIKFKAAYSKVTFLDKDPDLALCSGRYEDIVTTVRRALKMQYDKLIKMGDVDPIVRTLTVVQSAADLCYSDFASPSAKGYGINEELLELGEILNAIVGIVRGN